MIGGIRTHTIGVYLGLSPSSFIRRVAPPVYIIEIYLKLRGDLLCGNFSFTATPNANLSIRVTL